MAQKKPLKTSGAGAVTEFLDRAALTPVAAGQGRLLFALDATASREATWDRAMHLQAQMFTETVNLGGLAIQLCYYRGHREFSASDWYSDSEQLLRQMTGVRCLGGLTQIRRILDQALLETQKRAVNAVVFIGDCVEENVDLLCDRAGQLRLRGTPLFVFHEGHNLRAKRAFTQIAQLSGGAYCPFDASSPQQLRELLGAVAVFAAGGRQALLDYARDRRGSVLALTDQMSRR